MRSFLNKYAKWMIPLSLVLVLVLGAVGTVSAAEFPKSDTIPAGTTIDDDVFIGGENVVMDGTINGMLFAGGTTITINGTVNGDALLTGQTITVSESAVIDGNLFIAGGDLTVNGTVTGSVFGGSADMHVGPASAIDRNFYYGGYSVTTSQGSSIGKDMFIGGYQAILMGDITRDLAFGGAAVELDGSVGRNATLDVGNVQQFQQEPSFMMFNPYLSRYVESTIQPGIHVSNNAKVGGTLTYTSSNNVNSALNAITSGSVIYQTPVPQEEQAPSNMHRPPTVNYFNHRGIGSLFFGAKVLGIVRNFLKLFALGALALWLFAKPFRRLVDAAYAEPMRAIGWGFVLAAIFFFANLIVPLVFLLVGILVGFFSLAGLLGFWFGVLGTALFLAFVLFFFVLFTVSKILAAYMFGRWIIKGLFKAEEEKPWLSLLLGVFLYVLIRAIPIVGLLAGFAALLIGTGAFWQVFIQKKAVEK